MAFWTRIFGDREPPPDPNYNPGDPDGVEFTGEPVGEYRNFPAVYPSPWSGWPDEWGAPGWEANGRYNSMFGINRLIDVAWAAIDLNASVLAAMPLYRLQSGEIIDNLPWMTKPDDIYASWQECAKQIFWDFQLAGEVFILPMSTYADGFPKSFRVVPPWLISVEMIGGHREYRLGANDVTDEILHIRYQSSTDDAHGHSPLEMAGARMVTAGLLTRYTNKLAETGGTPHYWINVEKHLNKEQADDLLDQWVESRVRRAGEPALLTGGAGLNQMQSMNAKDMTLLELQTFSEARISVLLGVPPFLIGLPMAQGESITYCVDTLTEILTRDGWRHHDQLVIGEEVLTLNHETGLSEWQPLLDVNRFAVVDRDMISIEMIGHSSYSTDDHQWPVIHTGSTTGIRTRMLRMSRDLKKHDSLITSALCADIPMEPKYRDELVELVAWFSTEGYVLPANTRRAVSADNALVGIAQSKNANPAHVERIQAVLLRLFPADQWSEYHPGNGMVSWRLKPNASAEVFAVMDKTRRKVVSREFLYSLTQAQLELFVQVSIWADGCAGVSATFKQKDLDRFERFELACILAGKSTQRHTKHADGCYSLTVRKRGDMRPVDADRHVPPGRERIIQHETFTGTVWCPTTPNGTWFARRRGTTYFTHNSNASTLFDFHDRSSLRPKATAVMQALSNWALPRGQSLELNRDDYSRPGYLERAQANDIYVKNGVLRPDEVRAAERFYGPAAAVSLTGGLPGSQQPTSAPPPPQQPTAPAPISTQQAKSEGA